MDQNPILIQRHHYRKTFTPKSSPEPLFLIHDGGGTVFSYFHLGLLGRTVYGISNPHFGTESTWVNGITSMAKYYADLIKTTYPSGDILLGGWSLGGLVAVQVAEFLSSDVELNVTGIVMIDSTFPAEGQKTKTRRISFLAETSTKPDMAEKTRKCMSEARLQIRDWKPPVWRSAEIETVDGQSKTTRLQSNDTTVPLCPPAILLRAIEDSFENNLDLNDASQDSGNQALGFDRYANFNLQDVVDTPGDHFSIFNNENVKHLSKRLQEACDRLSKISHNF